MRGQSVFFHARADQLVHAGRINHRLRYRVDGHSKPAIWRVVEYGQLPRLHDHPMNSPVCGWKVGADMAAGVPGRMSLLCMPNGIKIAGFP